MKTSERITLTELQLLIKDSLYLAHPDMYWVTAEISELKENYAGHCYLELIEKNQDEKNISARVKAIIWNKRFSFLRSWFENITGESLRPGIRILVKVKVEYHEIYGLSLTISDIDPAFTVGELAVKRQLIIRRLQEEGVFTMNSELDFPLLPQRVAVVSSKNAAGYTDFINHLRGNSAGYIFYTALIETPMQGADTEQGIIRALDFVAIHTDLFDLVVIIRGGGSQTDLSWFDNYNIAYHITQFPLPVLTGIGHEKDLSVADMVAYKALKTPTAVADFLVDSMNNTEVILNELSSGIIENSNRIIKDNKSKLETAKIKLIPVSRLMISGIREMLSQRMIEMISVGKEFIVRAGLRPANQLSRLLPSIKGQLSAKRSGIEHNLHSLKTLTLNSLNKHNTKTESLEKTLSILSPGNVLKRGYTITSRDGKIIKRRGSLKMGDHIDTLFTDGSVRSKVEQ
jgi:exodeoxyribonuclease VII large subunit